MRNLLPIFTLSVLLAFASCSDKRTSGKSGGIDSTHTREYISKISLQEPERALAIIDTMEMNKEASPFIINFLRFVVYHNGIADYKMADYYGRQALKDSIELKKDPQLHFVLLNTLASIANANSQHTQCLVYSRECMRIARENNNKEYEMGAKGFVALSMIKLGDVEGGMKLHEESMQEVIKIFDKNCNLNTADVAFTFFGNYFATLMGYKEFDKAEQLIPDLLYVTRKLDTIGGIEMEGYAEFRRLHTYGLLMDYYGRTGNIKEAEKYLAKIQKSKLAGTLSVEALVSDHYCNVKDVKHLAEITARIRKNTVAANDTLSEFFVGYVLESEKFISRERGNYREALEKAEVINSVKDSIVKRDNEQDGVRLSKIYETQEKERLLSEKDAQLAKHKNIFVIVIVVMVLGSVFIVLLLLFNRRVNRRNKTIVATINQMMQKENELTRMQLTDDAKNVNPEEIRLKQSLEMLKEDKPTGEIVTECGYRDANDFGKKFYDHFGIHAEEYRKWSKTISKQEKAGDDEAKQMKDSFIKNMSHEIRTPLNQIFGFVQLLTDPNFQLSDDEKRQYNEIIGEQTNYMTRMLNKFLEISEYESRKEPLPQETVSIADLFNEVNSVVPRPTDGVELTFSNNSGRTVVEANHEGLSRIIQCLVGNAVKFTSSGYISVECSTNADGDTIFTVTDTGKGIPEGDEERIFDRFYKVDEFVPGAGLGLSLVREIARCMDATVVLDRTYTSQGSRFVVTLKA